MRILKMRAVIAAGFFVSSLIFSAMGVSRMGHAAETKDGNAESDRDEVRNGEVRTAAKPDFSVVPLRKLPLHEHPTLLQMLKRNNDIRTRIGLRPHRISPALTKAAQNHANYMARTGDFNHYSNSGPDGRAQNNGYRGGVLENIAMGYSNVDSAFNGWQNSSGHWANMSSNTLDAGFGYQIGPGGACYWVAVYSNGKDDTVVEVADAKLDDSAK